jgi:hypothetical protein
MNTGRDSLVRNDSFEQRAQGLQLGLGHPRKQFVFELACQASNLGERGFTAARQMKTVLPPVIAAVIALHESTLFQEVEIDRIWLSACWLSPGLNPSIRRIPAWCGFSPIASSISPNRRAA